LRWDSVGVVIVEWECLKFSLIKDEPCICKASKEAIYCKGKGWICFCGKWTIGDDFRHIPRVKGIREVSHG